MSLRGVLPRAREHAALDARSASEARIITRPCGAQFRRHHLLGDVTIACCPKRMPPKPMVTPPRRGRKAGPRGDENATDAVGVIIPRSPGAKKVFTTIDQRKKVQSLLVDGWSIAEISREVDIPSSTVSDLKQKLKKGKDIISPNTKRKRSIADKVEVQHRAQEFITANNGLVTQEGLARELGVGCSIIAFARRRRGPLLPHF